MTSNNHRITIKESSQQQRQGAARSSNKRANRRKSAPAVSGMSRTDTSTIVKMASTPLFNARSKNMLLPYYSNSALNVPVTGASVSYIYSMNGLYDPDITGTGTQPMGFDQMMVFYQHYTVIEATITVTFRNYSSNVSPIVFLAVRGDVTNVPDPKVVMETGNTLSTQLMPSSTADSLKKLTLKVNIAKFFGFDDLMDSTVARGSIAANPVEGVFVHVGAFNNEVAAAGVVNFQTRIEYRAVFTEPRIITPSLSKGLHALIRCNDEKKL